MGPFPSWRDLRKDYGAVGDGKADDTAALQRALDDLIKHEQACVLYIPAGIYPTLHRFGKRVYGFLATNQCRQIQPMFGCIA